MLSKRFCINSRLPLVSRRREIQTDLSQELFQDRPFLVVQSLPRPLANRGRRPHDRVKRIAGCGSKPDKLGTTVRGVWQSLHQPPFFEPIHIGARRHRLQPHAVRKHVLPHLTSTGGMQKNTGLAWSDAYPFVKNALVKVDPDQPRQIGQQKPKCFGINFNAHKATIIISISYY